MKVWLVAETREAGNKVITSVHKTLESAKKRQRSLGVYSADILERNILY